MPDPSPQGGHYDAMLTNISVAYTQSDDSFIADKIFPIVPVEKASAQYFEYDRAAYFSNNVGPRPLGGRARQVGMKLSRNTYNCEEVALSAMIDDRERANQTDPFNIDRAKTKLLTAQHMINRDSVWATSYFKTGVWTGAVAGSATVSDTTHETFWNLSNSNPIKRIETDRFGVRKLTGMEPNVLVIGTDVKIALGQHPDLIDRIKYTQKGVVDLDLLAGYFGVNKVVVAQAVQNTADEGQTISNSWIFDSKSALLVYAAPEPALEAPSGGYIFAWNGLLGNGAFSPTAVEKMRLQPEHSDYLEVRASFDVRKIGADLGVFYNAIVQ